MARLLFVTGTPTDVRSGSGTFVGISVLRSALEAAGHQVDVLAPARGRAMPTAAGRLLFNVRIRSRAAEMARGADAVVGFDLDGLFLRREANPKHAAALKGVLADESRFEHGAAALRLRAEAFLEKLHVRRADRVIATSAHSARRIVEDYGIPSERIRIVPEPIDLARWTDALGAARPEGRGIAASVLCVAHLYPRKNIATLLEAFARVGSEATLRIVGTGPEGGTARADAHARPDLAGRVELLGHVSFERLAGGIPESGRCFASHPRQEGFGIVFLEAMAAGLPIVAARAAAVPEVVVDGECGLLVPPEDAARALRRAAVAAFGCRSTTAARRGRAAPGPGLRRAGRRLALSKSAGPPGAGPGSPGAGLALAPVVLRRAGAPRRHFGDSLQLSFSLPRESLRRPPRERPLKTDASPAARATHVRRLTRAIGNAAVQDRAALAAQRRMRVAVFHGCSRTLAQPSAIFAAHSHVRANRGANPARSDDDLRPRIARRGK